MVSMAKKMVEEDSSEDAEVEEVSLRSLCSKRHIC